MKKKVSSCGNSTIQKKKNRNHRIQSNLVSSRVTDGQFTVSSFFIVIGSTRAITHYNNDGNSSHPLISEWWSVVAWRAPCDDVQNSRRPYRCPRTWTDGRLTKFLLCINIRTSRVFHRTSIGVDKTNIIDVEVVGARHFSELDGQRNAVSKYTTEQLMHIVKPPKYKHKST